MLELIQPFVIALSIGMLVGIERERRKARSFQAMGVRSFMLLGLLGSISAEISSGLIAASIAFFVGTLIVIGYWRTTAAKSGHPDLGLTSEIAGAVVFGLGYLAKSQPLLTLILGVVVLIILLTREQLHRFSTTQIQSKDLHAAAIIMVLTIVVAPFLPNEPVDPWLLFNPRRFVFILIVLSLIQFAGYIALKVFGPKNGAALTGFLGGLVSSTALYFDLSQKVRKEPELKDFAFTAGMFAQIATITELLVLALGIYPKMGFHLFPPLMGMAILGGAITWLYQRNIESTVQNKSVKITNPLEFKAALKLAAAFSLALASIAMAHRLADDRGVFALAALGGVLELHSTSMATMALNAEGQLADSGAFLAVSIAVCMGIVAKIAILWTVNRGRFALITTLGLLATLIAGGSIGALVYLNLK
ncbi:MAG: DUF4010 domain-containing protein [Proteobacteria bacterium]|nr:DUF4010 domain-containing protein [Pseudomonadota bacterium]